MISLKFENEIGTLYFGGGGDTLPNKVKEITGLGFVPKQYNISQYAKVPGQTATCGIEPARTITISGDIVKCDRYTLSQFNRILSRSGELIIHAGSMKRKISCRCEDFVTDSRRKNFQPFVVQFVCDNPFFEDAEVIRLSLFKREDQINRNFTLPCIFTERIQRVNVANRGGEETQPKMFIFCNNVKESDQYGIVLTNHTTGEVFKLNYKMSLGEEICIDFANRTITSNMPSEGNNNGNLIVYMSDDSFLSNFRLNPGVNDVECVHKDAESDIVAVCEYYSKYGEAAI